MQMPEQCDAGPNAGGGSLDIRHIVVCGHPTNSCQFKAYGAARTLAIAQLAAGSHARIVLLTYRSQNLARFPLDIPIDILSVFLEPPFGRAPRIDRAVFECIFCSVHTNTVFHIHACRHPLLIPIAQNMRARGIAHYADPRPGSIRYDHQHSILRAEYA
jgi:hypothetical protein